MILFVWSLVSSAIEAARKRHIANFLRALLAQQRVTRNYEMLIWKAIVRSSSQYLSSQRASSSRLYRPSSEPKLDTTLVLQTDLIQVFTEKFETLRASEWRFCPSLWPCEEDSIYFVVHDEFMEKRQREPGGSAESTLEPNYFKLNEKCDRLAIHKTMTRCLYACSFDMFVDVVDAFSEQLLLDEHFRVTRIRSMFAPPQEMERLSPSSLRPDLRTSTLSLASCSQQPRPLPILQHLFWGDRAGSAHYSTNDRYGSEGNLDASPSRRHPRRPSSSSNSVRRRRYRSCTSPERNDSEAGDFQFESGNEEFRSLPRYIRQLNQRDFGSPRSSVANGYIPDAVDFNSLPRYIRQLDKAICDSSEDVTSLRSHRGMLSSASCSRPPTTSDSYTSSLAEEERSETPKEFEGNQEERRSSNGSVTVRRTPESHQTSSGLKSHFTMDELRMIDETDTETVETSREEEPEQVSYALLARRIDKENDEKCPQKPRNGNTQKLTNGSVTIKLENGDTLSEKITNSDRAPTPYPPKDSDRPISEASSCVSQTSDLSPRESFSKPPKSPSHVKVPAIEFSRLPPLIQQSSRAKRSTSVVATTIRPSGQRRLSAFSQESDRGRSVSPSFEHYQNRSLRGFTTAANPNRGSTRNSTARYAPLHQFLTSRSSTLKAMSKPNSVLVYTGSDRDLYNNIRSRLSSLLPPDEITVFNVSLEALQKQPWVEKSTVCVILASTTGLEDTAWEKIQSYFNQNGKIIFVCQNKLLSSITGCDSSKESASILRFAFGNQSKKLKETNKDFVKFLENNMKKIPKTATINETFRSKDVTVGANFTVVLKKEADTPLFLYMHNNGSLHASALFSDATTQELIAPNSNLLKDSLQSVGVNVMETKIPTLTKGILVAEYDSIIDEIAGLRLGEVMGLKPQILLRKSNVVAEMGLPEATETFLPIEVVNRDSEAGTSTEFDIDLYFKQLMSKIGQVMVVVDVATTTMDIIQSVNAGIPSLENVVVVANRQIHARGRGGNEFIAPLGTAMFNFSFPVKKSSRLAKNLTVVQHIFCVAIVEAARNLSGYPDFPLRIKWPNDLYYDRTHKVGGMLLQCTTRDDSFLVSIGCGLNVSNEKPTTCLNDMLPKEAETRITREQLIAETLNRFTYYMTDYENNGPNNFRKKYYEFWLHSQQEVLLADLEERVTIRGIDDDGYLQVRSRSNPDKIFSIGDDGNTFDMMKGLIRHKY